MPRLDLPASVTAELSRVFASLSGPADPEALLARLLQACAVLPTEVVRRLLAFRADPAAAPALLLGGLPIDPGLPPTPTGAAGDRPAKPFGISECAILSIAVLLGEPVAYRAEKNGALVQDMYPVEAERDRPSNESSAAPLGFHTELAFSRSSPERPMHAASPDFVLLLGLRCPHDRSATTSLADLRAVRRRLSPAHLAVLREPRYELIAPYSFTRDGDGSRPWSAPVALLHGPETNPSMAFDTACGVRALSPEAEQALDALKHACQEPEVRTDVRLRTGELLMIDNNRCAHARSVFPASFDGGDRWLQRVYVRRAIWPLAAEPASLRILA